MIFLFLSFFGSVFCGLMPRSFTILCSCYPIALFCCPVALLEDCQDFACFLCVEFFVSVSFVSHDIFQ